MPMPTGQIDESPVYQLLVTLRRSDPPIWRRIAVRGSTALARLHIVLQIVMGWTDSHIHEFVVGEVRYGVPIMAWPPAERARNERRFRLDQIVATVGDRFVYDYDFGDAWHIDIRVEAVSLPEPGTRYPRCLAGARACPPEDVGGIPGYADFLAALGDPTHYEHDMWTEWIGGSFDPEAFDREAVNRRLKQR
jgi:hypothetical protein